MQWAQTFDNAQTKYPALALSAGRQYGKLRLLQDVKTRWNSTYLMLVCFIRQHQNIDKLWGRTSADRRVAQLKFNGTEWKKAEYLGELMKPYAMHGATLGAALQPTIDMVDERYINIFDHLDAKKEKLWQKHQTWECLVLPAPEMARNKLSFYYTLTKGELSEMYNIGNMLNLMQKNTTYCWHKWEPELYVKLTKAFVAYFQQHYAGQHSGSANQCTQPVSALPDLMTLAQWPAGRKPGDRGGSY